MESVLMTYGGLWFAWFISFMSGGLVAAVVGTALVFNWIYLPWLNAKDKNQKLWSSVQKEPLHYALFTGTIKRCGTKKNKKIIELYVTCQKQ